jgi:IS5 family transposase
MKLHWLAAAAALILTIDVAAAQSTTQTRTRSGSSASTSQTTPAAGTTTTRRPRSAAQLRNDQLMRDCGAEWRSNRAALQAQGKTWRSFLPECRTRRSRG